MFYVGIYLQIHRAFWLLLRGGIIQSVPYTATIFWYTVRPHLNSNHYWFIHQSSAANTGRDTYPRSKEKLGEKWAWLLPTKYLFHTAQVSLTFRKILRQGAFGFTSLLKEVMLRIIIVLTNPLRTLGPVANTITTRPPRTTQGVTTRKINTHLFTAMTTSNLI
jgi:hypothetical protein